MAAYMYTFYTQYEEGKIARFNKFSGAAPPPAAHRGTPGLPTGPGRRASAHVGAHRRRVAPLFRTERKSARRTPRGVFDVLSR